MARIDAVVFDVGNVLIDLDHATSFSIWSGQTGVAPDVLRERFAMTPAFLAYERGEIDAHAYTRDFNETLGIRLTTDEFLAGWNAMFAGPVSGMQELLADLTGRARLFGFSNTNADHVACWPGRFDALFDPLETLFVSNELQLRKPDVESYVEVSKRMGLSPGRCLFLDDLSVNIDGARSAGFFAHQFTTAEDARIAIEQHL